MCAELLTRDNPLLSRPTKRWDAIAPLAANRPSDLSEIVASYLHASLSENTRRAYLSDLAHFKDWGGSIPATADIVAAYLAAHARVLSVASLDRRLSAISKVHEAGDFPNPTRCELVKATRRGIKRVKGVVQRRVAPLLKEDLFCVIARMGDRPKDIRDKALLLVGFAGAFRRSELVGLDRDDVEITPRGLVIRIRRSKTDQFGVGRKVGIPVGVLSHCPVLALVHWLSVGAIEIGSIFRRVDRHGSVAAHRLSSEAVALIIKERMGTIGFDAGAYSGHSLRAGFATSAALAGVPTWKIRQQTGHASDTMLTRYIRHPDILHENVVVRSCD